MAVWQEKGTRRRLAAVKNSGGGSFCSLKGGRAKALPFQLKNVFSALAEGNVTHLVAWQRNVSGRRLHRADWSCDAGVTAAQKHKKPDNQEAWMMFNQPNINQEVHVWVHRRLWIKKKTYFTWVFLRLTGEIFCFSYRMMWLGEMWEKREAFAVGEASVFSILLGNWLNCLAVQLVLLSLPSILLPLSLFRAHKRRKTLSWYFRSKLVLFPEVTTHHIHIYILYFSQSTDTCLKIHCYQEQVWQWAIIGCVYTFQNNTCYFSTFLFFSILKTYWTVIPKPRYFKMIFL